MKNLILCLALCASLLCGVNSTFGQATFSSGSTATELVNQIQGPGMTITNPTITIGAATQVGVFSNGINGANLGFVDGIILTCSSVTTSFTANTNCCESVNASAGTYSDPDLTALDAGAVHDVVILEFDFQTSGDGVQIQYQFASDEYPEYVCSPFNDIFGFFVSGGDLASTINLATVPGSSTPVAVNTINVGSPGAFAGGGVSCDLANSQYFIDNTDGAGGTVFVEYDGITTALTGSVLLTSGVTYHMKLALADAGDSSWDTGVFVDIIQALFLNATPVAIDDSNSTISGEEVSGTVAGNDSDADNDPLTFTVVSGPSNGVFEMDLDGNYTYTPDPDFVGTVTIVYEVTDGTASDTATLTIEVYADTDGDGIINDIDLDDDNDGIPDDVECASSEGNQFAVINGGFETPVVGSIDFFDESEVDGWETSASDNQLEIWPNGALGVSSYEGNQFAELNAYQTAANYQDINTIPGQEIDWSFAHRARQGTDVMSFKIGSTISFDFVQDYSATTAAWVPHNGTYTVPAGQFVTRFWFEAVSTGSGDVSVGNFIDGFVATSAVNCGADHDGDGIINSLDLDSDDDGITDVIEAGQ